MRFRIITVCTSVSSDTFALLCSKSVVNTSGYRRTSSRATRLMYVGRMFPIAHLGCSRGAASRLWVVDKRCCGRSEFGEHAASGERLNTEPRYASAEARFYGGVPGQRRGRPGSRGVPREGPERTRRHPGVPGPDVRVR